MKVLCGFSSQVVHSLLCVCPLQHQPPAVQMGTVAQCRERFLWETSTKSKLKMYWTHWTGSMLISCFTGDCLTEKQETERNRDRCTNLGILFSEEVNEAKTTVGSTDPFLWQADCLQLSKRTDKKKQHLHFRSDLTWLFYKNYKGTKSKTTILP